MTKCHCSNEEYIEVRATNVNISFPYCSGRRTIIRRTALFATLWSAAAIFKGPWNPITTPTTKVFLLAQIVQVQQYSGSPRTLFAYCQGVCEWGLGEWEIISATKKSNGLWPNARSSMHMLSGIEGLCCHINANDRQYIGDNMQLLFREEFLLSLIDSSAVWCAVDGIAGVPRSSLLLDISAIHQTHGSLLVVTVRGAPGCASSAEK